MSAAVITGKVGVFVFGTSTGPQDLIGAPAEQVFRQVFLGSLRGDEWTKVGEAEVSITLFDEKTMVAEQVAVLEKAIQRERADSHNRITDMTAKLQSLLAIEAST